jgi:hypothetical protein
VVRLASVEGAWSRVSGGSHGIRSVFVFVGVISGQSLLIYSYHLWRRLIAALVCWSFRGLARRLPGCLQQQALLRQTLSGSGDGGARTAARLRLALVVAR